MSYDAWKAGQSYGYQNPQAQVPTASQIPDYNARIAFMNGMNSTKK